MKVAKILLFLGGVFSHVRPLMFDSSLPGRSDVGSAMGASSLDVFGHSNRMIHHVDTNCYGYALSECAPGLMQAVGPDQKIFLDPGMIYHQEERGKEQSRRVPGKDSTKDVNKAVRQDLKRLGAKPLNATANVKDPDHVPPMSEEADCQMAICTGDLNAEVKKAQSRGDACFTKNYQEKPCGVINDYHVFAKQKGKPWTHKFRGGAVHMLPEGSHPLSDDVPATSTAGEPALLRATKCYFIDAVKKGENAKIGR